jgi:hypothetical protein
MIKSSTLLLLIIYAVAACPNLFGMKGCGVVVVVVEFILSLSLFVINVCCI